MQLRCPNCQAKLSFFKESDRQNRVRNGACPNCGQKIAIGVSRKALAFIAPLIVFLTWLTWNWFPPAILGLGAGVLIWLTVVKLDKAT
jgi:DNA-directed RNA polymerase subunit RPC12/RpoP